MALLRWDPWGELASLQRDMNTLFDRGAGSPAQAGSLLPAIDAYRTDEGMVVHVELPGLNRDEIDVSVDDGVLTVSGERKLGHEVAEDSWLRRERAYGRFERSFRLPDGTDPDAIEADFDNGVLALTIPHPEERKPRRIQIGQGAIDA